MIAVGHLQRESTVSKRKLEINWIKTETEIEIEMSWLALRHVNRCWLILSWGQFYTNKLQLYAIRKGIFKMFFKRANNNVQKMIYFSS